MVRGHCERKHMRSRQNSMLKIQITKVRWRCRLQRCAEDTDYKGALKIQIAKVRRIQNRHAATSFEDPTTLSEQMCVMAFSETALKEGW